MKLKKLYKESIGYPSIVIIIISGLYTTIYSLTDTQMNHDSMYLWYERVIMNIFAALIFSIVVGTLSLTIFLNKFKKVYTNRKLSGICWFLLPFGFFALVIGKAINELIDVNSTWEIIYSLLASVPFIIGLTKGYKKFRMQNNVVQ